MSRYWVEHHIFDSPELWHFSDPAYNELRILLFLSKREKLTFYFEKSEHIGLVVYWLTPVWAGRPRPRVSPLTLNSAPAPARVLISPKLRVVSHPTPGSSTARDNTDNSRHSKYIHVQLQKLSLSDISSVLCDDTQWGCVPGPHCYQLMGDMQWHDPAVCSAASRPWSCTDKR